MGQWFATGLSALALGWLAGLSPAAPPAGVVLSATPTLPVTELSSDGGKQPLAADGATFPGDTKDCPPETQRFFPGFLLGFHERSGWREPGRHPRAFGLPGVPIPIGQASKAKEPTTFPQAVRKYLQCLHGRCQGFGEETKAADKDKENDKKDDKNGENGTKSATKNGSGSSAGTGEDLGAERAGRSISIGGETGLLGKGAEPTWYSAHAQGTVVDAVHDHFHAPYAGPLSLLRVEPHATSETATLFFASRLWEGGEFVFNPEVAGGRGFSGSNGIAGFPNGEITRVGVVEPTPYFARLFLRQTIGFGGEQEKVEDGINQIAGPRDINRFTVALGRFSMTDVADDNKYSHDPRTQFLAWSIMYNGAWDYPANVRGYTDAVAIDFNQKNWALHYAIAAMPTFANGSQLDPHFLKANGQVLEWLGRYNVYDLPGNIRLLGYLNRARMGDYQESLALMPVNPNVTLTRSYRFKYGFGLSWDQQVTKDVGVFGRLGWNDGHTETFAFTPIDRLAEMGIWVNGRPWCRPHDQFGLALDFNGLAKDHRDYLAAGGFDFNIGDGKLNYAHETILEAVYNWGITRNILLSLDFQEVWNPAYNRDRGPVSVFQGRFHIEF